MVIERPFAANQQAEGTTAARRRNSRAACCVTGRSDEGLQSRKRRSKYTVAYASGSGVSSGHHFLGATKL